MPLSSLHQRLRAAAGSRSYRELGELTKVHPEAIRRYHLGTPPSVEYLSGLCHALDLNSEWLLTGRGPMLRADVRPHTLREANPTELLTAVAETLEKLISRVERLEVFIQTLEARLRQQPSPVGSDPHAQPPAAPVSESIRTIADGVARRSPPDAG